MTKKYFLLVFSSFLTCCNVAWSQMVGTDIFFQGRYLEMGQNNIGALGTSSSPAGYHPYPTSNLAVVYDAGHDGWTVGTIPYFGDYTYPGTPYEGWEIQVNGVRGQGMTTFSGSSSAFGGSGLTGGNVSYSYSAGTLTGNWAGTASGLTMTMTSVMDTLGSDMVFTVVLKNTSGAPIPGIYYMRTCDPDNDETRGGGFATNNTILHQNEDATHRVVVDAEGQVDFNHWSIATKDCRAVAFLYESWSPVFNVDQDLADVWSGTPTGIGATVYNLGGTQDGDYAIGLIFNVGTLNNGDSTVISYAYIFNDSFSNVDIAFPDPALVVNGVAVPTDTIPGAATADTFNSCAVPGLLSLPVSIANGSTGTWSLSTWTWSPATGLASTTGVTNTINIADIPSYITYTITGSDSAGGAYTCNNQTFYLTIHSCNRVFSNTPCLGDTLKLTSRGDSIGATYAWTGPAGFTSTMQNPYIFPTTMANVGEYYLIKSVAGVDSLDSTYATIRYLPAVFDSSNGPLCFGLVDTLHLFASPDSAGETFMWTGPSGFSSSLQNPSVNGFSSADTGYYQVVTTVNGCSDSATIFVGEVPPPAAPVLSDPSPYCHDSLFVPFTVSGVVAGATVLWYPSGTGGAPTTVAPTVNTAIPGTTTYWASQVIGSCESPRDSINVQVISAIATPTVTGTFVYCQNVGPFVPLTVNTATGGIALWYTTPTGGTGTTTEPTVDLSVATANHYYVSQVDSGCESPRTPVTITVNPHPATPLVTNPVYCQYGPSAALTATGTNLIWYGPGITPSGSTVVPGPTPPTAVAGVDTYYVTQSITTLGKTCTSDSAYDVVIINPFPSSPVTVDLKYCQFDNTLPLTATGTQLQWYIYGNLIDSTPVPPTNVPGDNTWYVTQSITSNGITCQSDSTPLTVTTIYKPDFTITPSQAFVCQFDSINLTYTGTGTNLYAPGYTWSLPVGAHIVDSTMLTGMPSIVVQFDSTDYNTFVYLTATDDSGFCSTTDSLRIRVVEQPTAHSYTKQNVCQGDTTTLALADESADAVNFMWRIDGTLLSSSGAVNIISSNSNSGGPFSISWIDTGIHSIQLNSFTQEGCPSLPTYDTVDVHSVPDASFTYKTKSGGLCLEDSVYFTAAHENPAYAYLWAPAHAFNNINSSSEWGRLEENQSVISLTVTDPFGCASTTEMTLDPSSCCTVAFPNAFTPGGTENRLFRPIFVGYHNFHDFRIANRWGQTIFESANSSVGWDGTFNGVPQDIGIYYYYIKFDCGGNTVEQKGDLTLIR
jgi:gliding motility-associated-like protein